MRTAAWIVGADHWTEAMWQNLEQQLRCHTLWKISNRPMPRHQASLVKFRFSVSREEQRRRFKERKVHPLKQWKLSPVDLASLDKWDDTCVQRRRCSFTPIRPTRPGRW